MANVQPLTREEASEFSELLAAVEQSMGYVPESMMTMAHMPGLLKAFAPLGPAIMGPGKVDLGLKSLVAQISSTAAGCRYCTAHSAEGAAHRGISTEKVENVWTFETNDLFSPAEVAALRLARDASVTPNASTPAHFEELAEHYSQEQVVEIVAVISFFGFLNRWNDTMATPLEDGPFDFATKHLSASGWEAGAHRE